jgi:hypothetical protein
MSASIWSEKCVISPSLISGCEENYLFVFVKALLSESRAESFRIEYAAPVRVSRSSILACCEVLPCNRYSLSYRSFCCSFFPTRIVQKNVVQILFDIIRAYYVIPCEHAFSDSLFRSLFRLSFGSSGACGKRYDHHKRQ